VNRVRYVDYYCRDLAPPFLAPLAIEYFLGKELKDPLLVADEVRKVLIGRCLFALDNSIQDLPADALRLALAGPLQRSGGTADRVDELVWKAKLAVGDALPLASACVNPSPGRAGSLGVPEFWSLGKALMPFTPTSLPTLIKVRQCRLCGCWVRHGDKVCPFCFIPAPRGRGKRAWERRQIRVQQPPAVGGAPVGQPVLPPDLRWDNPEALAAGSDLDDDLGEVGGEPDLDSGVEEDGDDGDEPEEPE
jgi:hypothetical protein